MSTKTEQIEKILEDFYNEEWRELEDGRADYEPWAEKIDALYPSEIMFSLTALIDRYQTLVKKIEKAALHPGIDRIERIYKKNAAKNFREVITDLKRIRRLASKKI